MRLQLRPQMAVVAPIVVCLILALALNEWFVLHGHFTADSSPTVNCATQGATKLSGVSGSVFSGTRQRNFTGTKLLGGFHDHAAAQHVPQANALHSIKWGVVTTIFKPSEAILDVISLHDWSVVVVGDEGGAPFPVSAPNVVFLDVGTQRDMENVHKGVLDLLPWKHFGRKNVGYLYAIAHGKNRCCM